MPVWDVIVVGGGPCGLSCAHSFKAAGLSTLVLEKASIAASIDSFPKSMRFFSTLGNLEIGDLRLRSLEASPTRAEAVAYYHQVVRNYHLDVRNSSLVTHIEGYDGDFRVRTPQAIYRSEKVVLATGYYGWPNLLEIEGERLPKVMHYFNDERLYASSRVMVIGGRNSAGNVALALAGVGAEVTVVHRGPRFSMKPWILDALNEVIQRHLIRVLTNSRALEIHPQHVLLSTPQGDQEIENDFVFAMTGYHRDHTFLKTNGIAPNPGGPGSSELESTRPGIYLAGAMLSGVSGCEVNIENGRAHAARILRHLSARQYSKELSTH